VKSGRGTIGLRGPSAPPQFVAGGRGAATNRTPLWAGYVGVLYRGKSPLALSIRTPCVVAAFGFELGALTRNVDNTGHGVAVPARGPPCVAGLRGEGTPTPLDARWADLIKSLHNPSCVEGEPSDLNSVTQIRSRMF
jgi:hypothetical protein